MSEEFDLADKVFKDPKGRWLTRSLFVESNLTGKYPALFSLDKRDHTDDYISAYRLYMETDDPTEYAIAMKMLGNYEHWKLLVSLEFFKPYVESWREEKAAAIRSMAVSEVRAIAAGGGQAALAANKWLAENNLYNTVKHGTAKRGRPHKAQKELFEDPSTLAEDAARIGL